jgi:hypothetical protein
LVAGRRIVGGHDELNRSVSWFGQVTRSLPRAPSDVSSTTVESQRCPRAVRHIVHSLTQDADRFVLDFLAFVEVDQPAMSSLVSLDALTQVCGWSPISMCARSRKGIGIKRFGAAANAPA